MLVFLGWTSKDEILIYKELTDEEYNNSISSLKPNKAAGFDDLNSNVVRYILDSIKKPLFHILHLSIKNGVFPTALKISK